MTVRLKQTMYQDLQDDTLWPYIEQLDYPWCHEGEDFVTHPAGSTFTGILFKGVLEIFIYPNLLDSKLKIYESILNNKSYIEVLEN